MSSVGNDFRNVQCQCQCARNNYNDKEHVAQGDMDGRVALWSDKGKRIGESPIVGLLGALIFGGAGSAVVAATMGTLVAIGGGGNVSDVERDNAIGSALKTSFIMSAMILMPIGYGAATVIGGGIGADIGGVCAVIYNGAEAVNSGVKAIINAAVGR